MSFSLSQYLFKKGIACYREGKYQDAIGFFTKATKKDPLNHKAWNALGVSYSKNGDYSEANTCFHTALRLEPESDAYLENLKKNRVHMRIHSQKR